MTYKCPIDIDSNFHSLIYYTMYRAEDPDGRQKLEEDGLMDAIKSAEIEGHLKRCPKCYDKTLMIWITALLIALFIAVIQIENCKINVT